MIVAGLVVVLALWPLASNDGGWTAGGTSGQWEWGLPTSGPTGPDRVWATNLDGLALNDAVDVLEIPVPDLAGAAYPVLVVHHWYHFGPGDKGLLEVDPGTGWQPLDPAYGYPDPAGFVGASGGEVEDAFPLVGFGTHPRVRFVFTSDETLSAEGWYITSAGLYDGDVVAPDLTVVDAPTDTTDLDGPYPIAVVARDDRGLASVRLVTSVAGGPETTTDLVAAGSDTFRGAIPGQPPGTTVEWRVVADDGEQIARFPETGDAAFRVFLPAPTQLQGPAGRLIGDQVALQWQAPDADPPVVGYEVLDDLGLRTTAAIPFASVPVTVGGLHSWTVRALYDLGGDEAFGDPSAPLVLNVEVPSLHRLIPDTAGPGERLWMTLTGQSLYLEQAAVQIDLGDGLDVEAIEVLDAERALVRVSVADDAVPGPRDVDVTGAQGAFHFVGAFEVLDEPVAGSDAVVTPSVVFQGRPTAVTVTAPTPFTGPVQVDAGPDLVILTEVEVDGEKLHFELLAPLGTAPGQRTLVLDDGDRIYGADLLVRESITELPGTCAAFPAPFPGAWVVGLALLAGRRRPAPR